MAFKYKIGDKVILTNGDIMTVEQINNISKWYLMREDPLNCYTDEMIEGLVEEETKPNIIEEAKTYWDSIKDTWICPEGYIFKDENGNVINATKIVLEKKKKEYPKTYKECFNICFGNKHHIIQVVGLDGLGDNKELFESFIKLKICRDAYWKIAGEEMGLGKPWEPDWQDDTTHKFIIHAIKDKIHCGVSLVKNHLFAFPTEEMRDAFYENFKELINECKELL